MSMLLQENTFLAFLHTSVHAQHTPKPSFISLFFFFPLYFSASPRKIVDALHAAICYIYVYHASEALGVGVAERDVRAEAAGARVRAQLRGLRGNGLGLRDGRGRQQGTLAYPALIFGLSFFFCFVCRRKKRTQTRAGTSFGGESAARNSVSCVCILPCCFLLTSLCDRVSLSCVALDAGRLSFESAGGDAEWKPFQPHLWCGE